MQITHGESFHININQELLQYYFLTAFFIYNCVGRLKRNLCESRTISQ